eukprot:CAMPEP_0179290398 /NCGR_PEP_ID=MMETSP0797-20121207/41793_1 /TAXON_ID=47934 /ORGANISM="Dinophysis acuminata, Strain DAEP01" /LENGTH=50 /DNA_ID=CAMNT_0020999425 /DNA_START=56 /DNA_END=205 /DNA_ORIENTATION=-
MSSAGPRCDVEPRARYSATYFTSPLAPAGMFCLQGRRASPRLSGPCVPSP